MEVEGLRLVNAQSVAAQPLPFGMSRSQLLELLEAFRGPADGGTNSECGAGPLDYSAWADGLTLWFQDGRFAGWALDPRAAGVHATMSGIGPGSTRRELEAAYQVQVEETTLGTEFHAGGIEGLLDGARTRCPSFSDVGGRELRVQIGLRSTPARGRTRASSRPDPRRRRHNNRPNIADNAPADRAP